MKNKKLEAIRQACIKANPEIVELKFGCKVRQTTDRTAYLSVVKGMTGIVIQRRFGGTCGTVMFDNMTRAILYNVPKEELEVIGRDIRLADILQLQHQIFTDLGIFTKDTYYLAFGQITETWKLLDDNLDHQSEETIDFIYQLIKQI